ncbi:hypothetical protein GQ42DRAFT_161191 [Ramicandelaber brevisporus]|nr:hypothetical protein GQ42DRAFT_161191 [Ramicandelaber brevisporus]
MFDQRRFATLRRKENAHTQTLCSRAGSTSERHVTNYPRNDFHSTPNSIAAISPSTTTILSRVCLFLCLIPSLPLRPSALSLNRTVSFPLAPLPPSLCTARVCSCLLVAPPSFAPRPFKTTTFPVGLLVRFLQLLLPSSTPPRSSLRVDTLLAGRSLLFAGPRLVASCRSCRLFQGGLVTPIADLAQLCLHPLGSAVYSPGRTFRRRCSLLPPPIYNATYKGSRLNVCFVQTTGLIRTRPNVTIRSNLVIWS